MVAYQVLMNENWVSFSWRCLADCVGKSTSLTARPSTHPHTPWASCRYLFLDTLGGEDLFAGVLFLFCFLAGVGIFFFFLKITTFLF